MRTNHRTTLALLTAALFAAACDSPAEPGACRPTGDVAGLPGTYTLATVNGRPLPSVIFTSRAGNVSVVSGSLDVEATGAFREVVTTHHTSGDQFLSSTDSTSGSFTTDRGIIHLAAGTGPRKYGSFGCGRITYEWVNGTFVYEK